MKIYIKRDKSNDRSRYIIYSESGEELYTVVGECKGRTERAYILCKERCVAKIRDTRLFMLRTCYVFTNKDRFHIVLTSTGNKMKISFHGIDFHIRGDVLNESYDLMSIDNSVVCCVSRRYVTHADALELNINDAKHILNCIVSAIFLDSLCMVDAMTLQTT